MSSKLELKVVLVGAVGVGKTSTVLRFVKDNFKEYLETTIGASYMSKVMTVENTTINYNVWDTAGQEKFHSLVPLYFRKAAAVLVVYDITRQKTYEDAKQWVKELKNQAPENVIIALAGNKLDLNNLRDIEERDARRYASEIGAIFIETSAKDSTGIANIFEQIGRTYLSRLENRKKKQDPEPEDDNSSSVIATNSNTNTNVSNQSGSGRTCC